MSELSLMSPLKHRFSREMSVMSSLSSVSNDAVDIVDAVENPVIFVTSATIGGC
jgi:hypothetical protein